MNEYFSYDILELKYNIKVAPGTSTPFKLTLAGSGT